MDRHTYRAKSEDTGEWVFGSLLIDFGGESWIVGTDKIPETQDEARNVWNKVNEATIGQCTGLTGEDSAMIYEGDIVREGGSSWLWVVCWDEMTGAWMIEDKDGCSSDYLYPYAGTYEVVGNEFDNPELLESGDEE